MRFTRRKKTLILLYLNLVLTITALGSFTYTTMAWFMSERIRQIHASSVQVAAPGFTVDNFTCYGVDVIQKETSTSTSHLLTKKLIFFHVMIHKALSIAAFYGQLLFM